MAVSPIGNITYINQNMQTSSIQHANAQQRVDFQALVNMQELDEKLDEIQEVRPTEESELNPDRDKEKEEWDTQEQEQEEQSEQADKEVSVPHILDIHA